MSTRTIEIHLIVEDVAEPHIHMAPEHLRFTEVIEKFRQDGKLVGELILVENDVVLDPEVCVGGGGDKRVIHGRRKVEITINGEPFFTHRGRNSVAHLEHLGHLPKGETLVEKTATGFDGEPVDGFFKICGGECFASCVPTGGAS